MSDFVSFEIAKRLKDAGFPQPKPAFGQAWYDGISGTIFLVVETFDDNPEPFNGIWIIEKGGDIQHAERDMFDGFLYAPTITDILRELPGACLRWNGSEFLCKYRGESYSENSAEATAKMWIVIKKV